MHVDKFLGRMTNFVMAKIYIATESKNWPSRKRLMTVIPAKTGIQFFQRLRNSLNTGFHSPRKRLPQRAGETTTCNSVCGTVGTLIAGKTILMPHARRAPSNHENGFHLRFCFLFWLIALCAMRSALCYFLINQKRVRRQKRQSSGKFR